MSDTYVEKSFINYKDYLRSWETSLLRYGVDEIWDLINIVLLETNYNIAFLSLKESGNQVRFKSTVLDKKKPIILVYEQSPEVFFLLTDRNYKPLANKQFQDFLYKNFPVDTNVVPSLIELTEFISSSSSSSKSENIRIQYQIRNSNGQAIRLVCNNIEIPCRPSACQPGISIRDISTRRIEFPQVGNVVALLKKVDEILALNKYEFQYNKHIKYTPVQGEEGNFNGILIDDIYFIHCARFTEMERVIPKDEEPFIYDEQRIDLDIQFHNPNENKLQVFMKEITTKKDIFFDYYNAIKINMTIDQKCRAIRVLYSKRKISVQLKEIFSKVPNISFLNDPTEKKSRSVKKIDEKGNRIFEFINVGQDRLQDQLIQDITVNLLSRQYIFNPQYLLVYKS